MAKKCFLSFHYKADSWRVSQIKNIGAIDEQPILSANDWEAVKKKGDAAIKKWIDDNMYGRVCQIVLVGAQTSKRPWVKYEIEQAWSKKKGVLGVYIHNLKDSDGNQSSKGANPFSGLKIDGKTLTDYVLCYDPPYSSSTYVYDHIKDNIESWVDAAVKARNSA